MDDKVRENRLRRLAKRRGLVLSKVRRRDPRAWDYGLYYVCDTRNRLLQVDEPDRKVTLDDVEWLLNLPESELAKYRW
jgi:hypothetical protein